MEEYTNEEWRPVACADPIYLVSNYGRVKSFGRNKTDGRILKQVTNWAGYKRLGLLVNGKQKIFSVHRIVAEAFVQNPENKETVNHINEDRTDNRACNLEWMTVKENCNYGSHNKRVSEARKGMKFTKEHCDNMSKARKGKNYNKGNSQPIEQLTLDGELVATYPSISEAHRATGYSKTHIACCCMGREKSLRGYLWRYKYSEK